ncbi:cell wall-binding repeat-containing protein [Romboutsia sp. 1001216sp1]|uniref:cell wall-binding repeat-containing protein n=1 Tax=Romboutsia sp. 1001216sp1 TaxID=2986997 RepID=UPI00232B7189|nr:cell wall-binding repeat-containing protein [Romboutsia sp. 1001216sp1]MDB8804718.1 cell wall-binding repeat-containing protein [Romboutsia sp. 1001216sp1]MDB8806358.1 cell wall-binding repeat-containing protein [Romboutsia sp. 1001216sp1]MDB8810364.1 cell wall-binding repeat-containing protein [Romboutsia sp. 1001216sp1]MDB8816113.1 cell wall-binding repeat-containing protein [Romboutsia sp. 1001216sp1]MDB8818561.1 cell wall-binding repeat-containing protein [Romboutsia sp. 1001216sp1]
MKKRNMAITIAAVSAATSVAPALAFADTLDNQVIASTDANAVNQLKGEIQGFLNTKYTNEANMLKDVTYQNSEKQNLTKAVAGQCVYTIQVKCENAKNNISNLTDMDQLDVALAQLNNTDNRFLNIEVIDNGHNTVNGQIVNWKEGKYTQEEVQALLNTPLDKEAAQKALATAQQNATNAANAVTAAQSKKDAADKAVTSAGGSATTEQKQAAAAAATELTAAQEAKTAADKAVTDAQAAVAKAQSNTGIEDVTKVDDNTVSLTLKNNKTPLVIKTGDTILNLQAPIYSQDKSGSYLDKDGQVIAGVTTNEQAATNDNTVVTGFEVAREDLQTAQNGQPSDFEATRNYGVDYKAVATTNYKAQDLYDSSIGRFTDAGNQLYKFIQDYNAIKTPAGNATIGDVTNGTLTITFPVDKTEAMKNSVATNAADGAFAKTVISGSNNDLTALKQALTNNAPIKTLAGADRYDTAVQVSKAAFTANNSAQNVVLVSGTALADGLTATPFAASKNAPILLTGKDKVNDKTMAEIARVLPANGAKNVYVIGGENTISKSVETQLKAKGYTVTRIQGDDRYQTSLAIAKVMEPTLNGDIYVAGGYAEPDAMSIAPIAARKGATNPILLANDKTGLSTDQINYISGNKAAKSYIIGGADRAPESIKTQLKDAGMTNATERLSGADRQGTNAAVIKEFATADNMKNLYVAKSDNQGLVDALSAGVLAGQTNSPVVLATNAVNAEQQSVIKAKNPTITNKTQIGEGIAAQVWSTINNLFTK